MKEFKAEYDTRLLYRQKYETEEGVHVDSIIYAVMWSYSKDIVPTTSRLRYTILYTKESGLIQPIQALIEQWKGEGWTIIDEFTEAHITFDHESDFENHLAEMAKSFLLGVPIGSKVVSEDSDPKPGDKATVVPGRVSKILSKDNAINIPKSKDTTDKVKKEVPKEDTYAKEEVFVKEETPLPKDDDSDDDDWL